MGVTYIYVNDSPGVLFFSRDGLFRRRWIAVGNCALVPAVVDGVPYWGAPRWNCPRLGDPVGVGRSNSGSDRLGAGLRVTGLTAEASPYSVLREKVE